MTEAEEEETYMYTLYVRTVEPPNKGHAPNKGQDSEHQKSLSHSANTLLTSEERTPLYDNVSQRVRYILRFHCTTCGEDY